MNYEQIKRPVGITNQRFEKIKEETDALQLALRFMPRALRRAYRQLSHGKIRAVRKKEVPVNSEEPIAKGTSPSDAIEAH